jgi:hypothetical protein
MAFGDVLDVPVKIGEVGDPESYYKALPGSALLVKVFDNEFNLIARGLGFSWAENYQNFPVMELGQRHCIEIVKGAMPPGQINYQGMYFMNLNDTMPTYKNLVSTRELSALVQIADHEDASLNGIVLDVFQGLVIQGQQGNFNAQTLYLRNCNMIYRTRLTGLEWKNLNPAVKYPAASGGVQTTIAPAGMKA